MDNRLQRKITNLETIERFPASEAINFVTLNEMDEVLDLGAGTGYITFAIANLVKSVQAFDFDQDILTYIETKAEEQSLTNVQTTQGDFKAMPFAESRFDKAIASISLHEVEPLDEALQEIYRVLKDDGLFLCIEMEKENHPTAPRVSSIEMEEAMRKAGFTIVDKRLPATKIANQSVYVIVGKK